MQFPFTFYNTETIQYYNPSPLAGPVYFSGSSPLFLLCLSLYFYSLLPSKEFRAPPSSWQQPWEVLRLRKCDWSKNTMQPTLFKTHIRAKSSFEYGAELDGSKGENSGVRLKRDFGSLLWPPKQSTEHAHKPAVIITPCISFYSGGDESFFF